MSELAKVYDPKTTEQKWYDVWLAAGHFHADEQRDGPRFSLVIPPPNVTGMLHMGHILNNTLQDILARFERMQGRNTLWMPGTDHAGIATQNVVEKQLAKEGKTRQDLGRERFIARVWEWKEQYGGTILRQLQRLGASCDWQRECFTMDEPRSHAVREVFVRLYEKGLIYRGNRIIHWCVRCHTALADEEAVTTEGGEPGSLWHIRYPAEDGREGVVVATTRPETMLGDTGVAVSPDDERYHALIGSRVVLPLMQRPIPVVADPLVDKTFGTGAVKVTPAHDANDFEMGQRHGLEPLCIMGTDGVVTAAGGSYAGLDRFAARERIVADLMEQGLLVKTEPYRVPVRRCYRCDTIVEPYLSLQWFVKMQPLAVPAIAAVKSGRLRLIPERWTGVYLHWMENIRDWCISRQLWWGHRIPVWYCDDCEHAFAARTDPNLCPRCSSARLRQDSDVLDTWFSSWLWPFSTMGWPEQTPTLARFYPTDTLVTAADIIFFWVARMVMAGYEFIGECPFQDVYLNSIVRDGQGRKMSKSLGNSPDPIDVIDQYGADAMRFTIVSIAPVGQDVRYDVQKTEFGRNFANKIWNVARFALMQLATGDERQATSDPLPGSPPSPDMATGEGTDRALSPPPWPSLAPGEGQGGGRSSLALPDRWILSRLQAAIADTRGALGAYRFNDAATTLYRFIWGELCDWYVELIKPALYGSDEAVKQAARATLVALLDQTMRLLHPFMPFITEEIWQALPMARPTASIVIAPYPVAVDARRDPDAEARLGQLIEAVTAVRNIRAELGLAPSTPVNLRIAADGGGDGVRAIEDFLKALAKVGTVELLHGSERPHGEPSAVVAGLGELFVPLRGVVDPAAVRERLARDLGKVEKELTGVDAKLARPDFVEKAPADVVEKERARAAALSERRSTLQRHLEVLREA
jgi:valyl-tRNA synthetase